MKPFCSLRGHTLTQKALSHPHFLLMEKQKHVKMLWPPNGRTHAKMKWHFVSYAGVGFLFFFCTDVIVNHMLCKGFWMIDQNPLLFTFYVVLGFVGWANLAAVGVILFHLADVGTKTFRQGFIGDTRQLDVVDVAVAVVTNVSRRLMVAKRQKKPQMKLLWQKEF